MSFLQELGPNAFSHPPPQQRRRRRDVKRGQRAELKRDCCGVRRSAGRACMSPARRCSISRCINMCHVSHTAVSAGDGGPDGTLNAAVSFAVSFSRLVHPSLARHLVPPQPVMGALTLGPLQPLMPLPAVCLVSY